MGIYHLMVPGRGKPLLKAFDDMPQPVRSYIRQGLGVLNKLAEGKRRELLQLLIQWEVHPHYIHGVAKQLASRLEISPDDASPLLAATSTIAMALSERNDTAKDIVEALSAAKLLSDEPATGVQAFCEGAVAERLALKRAIEQSTLSAELLPSLVRFSTTVDVRPRFENEKVAFAVPVVLALVDTDAPDNMLWFQMSRIQLEKLIDDLNVTLRRVNEVTDWMVQRTKD